MELNEILKMQPLTKFSLTLFITTLSVYILMVGRSIFLPIVIALVIGYFIITLVQGIRKIEIGDREIPYPVAYLLSVGVIILALWIIFSVVSVNVGRVTPRFLVIYIGSQPNRDSVLVARASIQLTHRYNSYTIMLRFKFDSQKSNALRASPRRGI